MTSLRGFQPVEYADRWFLELEKRGELVTHMGSLQLLDGHPSVQEVIASIDFLSNLVPRFRRKVIELSTGLPVWTDAQDFRPENHLQVVDLRAGGIKEILAASARFYPRPFDRSRPLWEVLFLRGSGDTPSALFFRNHHMIGDGISLFRLEPTRPLRDKHLRAIGNGDWQDRRATLITRAHELRTMTYEAVDLCGQLLRSAHDRHAAVGQLRSLVAYARTAREAHRRRPTVPGLKRYFAVAQGPTEHWRDMAHRREAGLNELFLAIGIRSVAEYWRSQGVELETVNVGMPVNARSSPDDPEAGNKVLRAWFKTDPRQLENGSLIRLRGVALKAREPGSVPMTPLTDLVLRAVPRAARLRFQLAGLAATDLLASNLRYPRERYEFANQMVTVIYGFAPAMGLPVSMALCTYGDLTSLGLNIDVRQVVDPELFEAIFAAQVDDLVGQPVRTLS